MTQENLSEIFPFGQTERVGNYKLWRGKYKVKTSDGTAEIDCVHVSDLSGSWSVRIPETYEMYGIITSTFADFRSDDAELRARALGILQTVFGNMMFASVIGNGYFQKGVEMLAMVYANPGILSSKDGAHKDFMNDVKSTVRDFLEWREDYDKKVQEYEPSEADLHREDLADQAADIITSEQ